MKAPEKLYVDTNDDFSDSVLYGFTEKCKDDDIEYSRKDVFIEKAAKWINEHTNLSEKLVIDDFKKYMEE